MTKNGKIILDLCGGTGAWSQPYKDAGYDVRVITMPYNDVRTFVPPADVYGILAAPPCTEFSRAKTTAPRQFRDGMSTVRACMEIIWEAQFATNAKLQFWALENPMGLLRRFLGRPSMSFEPWWYGDEHSKQTDLWGWFNEPKRTVFKRPDTVERSFHNCNSKFYGSPKCPERYKHLKLDRSGIRAITPPNFAKAFFWANQ